MVGSKVFATSMGYQFEEVLIEVDGNMSLWETKWKTQTISKPKLYWGIYPIETQEAKNNFLNEIDSNKIDEMFPLAIGNETSFSGNNSQIGVQNSKVPIWI